MKKYSLLALMLLVYSGYSIAKEVPQPTVIPNNSDIRYVTSVKEKPFNPLAFMFHMLATVAGAGALYQGKDLTEKCLGAGLLTLGGLSTLSMTENYCDSPHSNQFRNMRSCICRGMNTVGLAAWLVGCCSWLYSMCSETAPDVYRNMKDANFVPAASSLALCYCIAKVLSKGFPAMWHSMVQEMENKDEETRTVNSFVINKNPNNEPTSIEVHSQPSSHPMPIDHAPERSECVARINCCC